MARSETKTRIRIREIAERCAEKAGNLKKSTKGFELFEGAHIRNSWPNPITELSETQGRNFGIYKHLTAPFAGCDQALTIYFV